MATRLEILLATIFDSKGTEEAKASIKEVGNEMNALASSDATTDLSAEIDITVNDEPLTATREEIKGLAELAPVIPLMTDDSQITATREEIKLIASEIPIIHPQTDNSALVATRAEIQQLSNLRPMITPMADNSGLVATREEIQQLATEPIVLSVDVVAPNLAETAAGMENIQQIAAQGIQPITSIVQPEFIQQLSELRVGLEQNAQAAREALREAEAFGAEDKMVAKLRKTDREARSAADSMHRLTTVTKAEALEATKVGQSLSQQVAALKKASKGYKQLAEQAKIAGRHTKAEDHLATAAAIDREATATDRLNRELRETGEVARTSGQIMNDKFLGVESLKQFSERAKEVKTDLDAQKDAALASGQAFRGGLDPILDQQQALQGLTNKMVGTEQGFKLLGKEVTGFGGLMKKMMESSFNQLGFVMFITLNTIKSLVTAMKQFVAIFTEGAEAANNFRSVMLAANQSAGDLDRTLSKSSQHILNTGTAASEAAFFIRQYGDEYPDLVDKMASGAAAATILGGSMEEGNKFFADQLSAVADLTASHSRYGNAVFDTTAAQDAWNIAAANGEELLDSEKRAILVDVLNSEISAWENATRGMEPYNTNMRELTKNTMGGWTAVKAFAGSGLSTLIGLLKDTGAALTGASGGATDFVAAISQVMAAIFLGQARAGQLAAFFEGGMQGMLLAFIDDLDGAMVATLGAVRGIKVVFLDLLGVIGNMGAAIGKIGDGFDALLHLDFSGMKDAVSEIPNIISDAFAEFDIVESFQRGVEEAAGQVDKLLDPMRNALGEITEDIERTKINFPQFDFSNALDALDAILGGQFDLQQNMQAAWDSYNEEIKKISDDLTESLKELQDKRNEDLLKAQEEFAEKSADAAEDLSDKILDINGKLQLKEFRTQQDAEDNREKARRKRNKKMEDIEEAHQKKINDILRRFDLSRLKALIDRDARALFEAERRRDEDLKGEQEANEKKKEDARDDLAEKLADIDAAEKKKLERMREDAEISRRTAIKDMQDKLDDLKFALAEELAEIEDNFVERRNVERREAFAAKIAAKKTWNDKKAKLIADLKTQEHIEHAATLQRQLLIIQDMQDHGKNVDAKYAAWLTSFTTLKNDHNEIVGQFNYPDPLNLTGVLTPLQPPSGPGGSDPVDNCVPGATLSQSQSPDHVGQSCSGVVSTTVHTACDGTKWQCVGGAWVHAGTVAFDVQADKPKKRTLNGIQSNNANDFITDATADRSGNGNQVTIVVENDKTLEQIFSEIAYTAFVSTIE